MATRAPFFPLSHGVPPVDDRRVIRGILSVIRDGLRWKDAPKAYGPHKTLYNRFVRWPRLGVFQRIVAVLPKQGPKPSRLMIAASHVKAHRPGAPVRQQGGSAGSDGQQVDCIPGAMRFAMALAVRYPSP